MKGEAARPPRSLVTAGNASNGLEHEPRPVPVLVTAEPATSMIAARALLDYEQLSTWLGIPVATLRSMVSRRTIPCLRLGPRIVRFDRAEVDGWLAARRIAATGGAL